MQSEGFGKALAAAGRGVGQIAAALTLAQFEHKKRVTKRSNCP